MLHSHFAPLEQILLLPELTVESISGTAPVLLHSSSPMAAGSPTTMLSTPGGTPLRAASSASASAVSGVASAGLSTSCSQVRHRSVPAKAQDRIVCTHAEMDSGCR